MNNHNTTQAAKEPPKTKFVPPPPRGGSRLKTNNCRAAYWRRRAMCMEKKLATASREAHEAKEQVLKAQAQLKEAQELLVKTKSLAAEAAPWEDCGLSEEWLQEFEVQRIEDRCMRGEADDQEYLRTAWEGFRLGFAVASERCGGGVLSPYIEHRLRHGMRLPRRGGVC